jgi:hypothetical protein
MALNSQYVLAFFAEQYFVDKDTGLPLAGGKIKFFEDLSRNTAKDVFILSGSPPNYSYVNISHEVDLGSDGCPNYLGENVAIYLHPYDVNGNLILYYYTVEAAEVVEGAGGVLQFTREGQPNLVASTTGDTITENLIPNGQFLLHTNIPADPQANLVAGQISEAITDIAYGGWTFERPNTSSATDIVTFTRFGNFINPTPPDGNPRYRINVACQSASIGDAFKDLRLKYKDVNKFNDGLNYSFNMTSRSLSGAGLQVSLYLIKNFGTSGSTETETLIDTFTLTAAWVDTYNITFSFEDNNGKTIGPDDDDYLQLALRFPTSSIFEAEFTDFILTPGTVPTPIFPSIPDSEMQRDSLVPPIPAYDSSNLYLPLILTPSGLAYDSSEIGDVIAETAPITTYTNSISTTTNRLLGDGTKYLTEGYSPLGIPFSRLQSLYWNTTFLAPLYGTGLDYFTSQYNTTTSLIYLYDNSGGLVTDAADGATPTGFTFATICPGVANTYASGKYLGQNSSDQFLLINDERGKTDTANVHTSGFTFVVIRTGDEYNGFADFPTSEKLKQITLVTVTAGASISGGDYFTFTSIHSTVTASFYVWFKVDGAGVDPAVPGHTGIEVDILSTNTADDIAFIVAQAVGGHQMTTIAPVAAAGLSGGEYFTASSTGDNFYVWFKIAGVGTDPNVPGAIAIEVDLTGSETAAQVATAVVTAINMKYFASPNLQGYFLRGYTAFTDVETALDPDGGLRWSQSPFVSGANVGTYGYDDIITHIHRGYSAPGGNLFVNQAAQADTSTLTGATSYSPLQSGYESKPINVYVNFVIKY